MAFKLDNIPASKNTSSKQTDVVDSIWKKEITLFGNTFGNKQKEDFYTELSVLLKAGVILKEALSLIKESQKKEKQRIFFDKLLTEIVKGTSFSEVMQQNKAFTAYEYHSVRIGEETGNLGLIARELGDFYSRKNEQRRNVIGALTYPLIIFITAVAVVGFMLSFVVPMFQDIFQQNNVELPWITRLIIALSKGLKSYGWLLLLFTVLAFILAAVFGKNENYQRFRDRLLVRLPFFGSFIKTVYLAQFAQAVSLLTASKVPIVNSMQLVSQMIGFYPIKIALQNVEQLLLKGVSLSDALRKCKVFDNKMVALVKVAEETNQTEFIFNRLNQQYNIQVQQRSKMLSTIMEPLIILFVGVLVGVILIAMYLPMFKLSSVLG
ncbi:type II secretion system F family protein [Flavobacteriaceae bacterium M23B6Z8]